MTSYGQKEELISNDDVMKEYITNTLSKALGMAEESARGLADNLYLQAVTSETRALVTANQLTTLRTLTEETFDALASLDTGNLNSAQVARRATLMTELGKMNALIQTAAEQNAIGNNLGALSKGLGPLVGSWDLLVALNNNASQEQVAKEAYIAGVGILAGVGVAASAPLWVGVAVGIGAGALAKYTWQEYISPFLSESNIDLTEPFWDSLFNSLGFSPKITSNIDAAQQAQLQQDYFDYLETGNVSDALIIAINLTRNEMVELAQEDEVYREALLDLDPYVFLGLDGGSDQEYTDGSLDLYDPETGKGAMSEMYLKDRAAMLTWKIRYDTGMQDEDDAPHNGVKPYNQDWDTTAVAGNWDFVDHTIRLMGGAPLTLAIDGTGPSVYDHQIVFGSKNNDSFNGSGDADHLYGMAGNDTINGDDENDWIEGGLGNDTLMGGDEDDEVYGGAGNDTLYGDDDSILDIIIGGKDTLHGGDGDDKLLGEGGDDTLYGDADNDKLYGEKGKDTLYGGEGNDRLEGGDGDDTLHGGTGHDIYVFNSGIFTGEGTDTIIDEDRDGKILFNSKYLTGGSNDRGNGLWIDYPGTGAPGAMYYRMEGSTLTINDYYKQTKAKIENFNSGDLGITLGGGGADNATGTSGDDYLWGNAGSDVLDGGAGNDILNGATGADTMLGGAGNDTYVVDDSNDIAQETDASAAGGIDKVQAYADYTLGDHIENLDLLGKEAIDGSGNDLSNSINGNAAANTIDGGMGDDMINGGAGNDILLGGGGHDVLNGDGGNDTLVGWSGNDTYTVDSIDDIVIEHDADIAIGGNDTVQASVNYLLSANIENLTLIGTASINGTGNALNNTLIGNAANNTLEGGAGNDTLNGGAGADSMQGGQGDDSYVVDNVLDAITEAEDEGLDLVQSAVTYALSAHVENLTLTGAAAINGTGNTLNNVLTGNAAANVLDGGSGADQMAGGAGNDIYMVDNLGDIVTEGLNAGTDTVQTTVSYTLGANLENLTLIGTDNNNATGNTLNNILTGNSGNNVLDGGAGNDAMLGGLGDDSYIVDSISDVVTEVADAGVDTIQSSVSYNASANVENLTLTGAAAINGTGNALNNVLIGNAAANILSGGLGADSMLGGTGNDTYVVDHQGDTVTEQAEEGIDTVQSSITYSLGANVENLTLTGTAIINATGNALNNILTGNAAANVLDGGLGADNMLGGAGDDTYTIDSLGDIATEAANAGVDTALSSITYTLSANVENLTLTGADAINGTGNTLNNILIGNAANNILDGGAGNDTLDGGLGADTMLGGAGNDIYMVDNLGDIVTEGLNAGTDTVQTTLTYILGANLENLTLTGTGSINGTGNTLNNTLVGNAGNNVLDAGAGVDILNGGLGDDTMIGGAGNDTYVVDSSSDVVIETDSVATTGGIDLVQASATFVLGANIENLTLTGTTSIDGTGNALNNTMIGNAANNILDGGAGNDSFTGNGGDDTFIGGAGNDTYTVDSITDIVIESDANLASGGTDLISASVSYILSENVENLTLTGTAAINATGNAGNNSLLGNTGVNLLDGGAGNDVLNGGTGADTMLGGTGDDIYVVDNIGDVVTENIGEGLDTVQSSITYALGSDLENLTLTGTAAINASGNALNNIITGNAAANVIDGGLGADQMAGGAGNDIYVVDDIADVITEALNAGTDTVQTALAYTLGTNLENLTLTGTDSINGTGNALNNTLLGNAGSNVLDAGAGVDILNGGLGDDTMIGGAGNDTYVVDSSSDVVIETDSVATTGGVDLVQTSVSYALSANVENLTLTGTASIDGTGNELGNVLTGNSGNNMLDGGAGNDTFTGGGGDDTFIGGAGNDTYTVDSIADVIIETDGTISTGGTDLVNASVSFRLSTNVENLTLTGTTAINGIGNDANNTLLGNIAANVLDGGAGNDTLNGGAGADTMLGGTGDDTYVVDNVADVVTEGVDAGNDTVQSSITYALGSNLENLTLTGTAAINGSGNALNNVLTGNAAANTLNGGLGDDIIDGGAGNDNMIGGIGNDSYYVNVATDIVTENADEGTDTVFSAATYTLGANLENLTLTGTAAINGTGNALNNVLTGNAAANLLNGGIGADTMIGGAGNDIYIVDHQSDSVIEALGAGTDTVQTELSYTLGDHLENLTLTGATLADGTGNSLNNIITGNTANNVLNGGAGNDTMAGGAGDDTYIVDSTLDVVTEAVNAGTDTIASSITFTLSANVENLTLTGSENINAIGNTFNNTLIGNAANNLMNGGAGADTMLGGTGDDTYVVDHLGDTVTEIAEAGNDTVQSSITYTLGSDLENLTLTGTAAINGTGNALNNVLTGNAAANTLIGGLGDDVIDGGLGNDTMIGGEGNDKYSVNASTDIVTESADQGIDTVTSIASFTLSANLENLILSGTAAINGTGNILSNHLLGNAANNTLTDTLGGNDIIQGLAGVDTLNDTLGNNLLDGGLGDDTMTAGTGNDLLLGGLGNDTLITGTGYDIISFNKGDGQDRINASTGAGADNTISLGGAFAYNELSLNKSGNDLTLKLGATDQLTLKDWYLGTTNKSVVNLQVIAEAVAGFNLGGTDALRNNKVETFNFANLVAAFDADVATNSANATNWQLTDTRLTAHLAAGSDSAAIGGDLAYQYGRNGNLTGMGLNHAQSTISTTNFGQSAQTLNNPTVWQAELVKLG